jgi:hypothetical protein
MKGQILLLHIGPKPGYPFLQEEQVVSQDLVQKGTNTT